jgi:hypothetical protein
MGEKPMTKAACRLAWIVLVVGTLCNVIHDSWAAAPPPLPEGNNGIAAHYPGDANIRSDPNVLFADDFESYSSASQLWNNWSNLYQQSNARIATETGNFYAGGKGLEFTLPQMSAEVANAIEKSISPTEDTVFVRVYTKFDAGFNVIGSGHNGITISSHYCCPGVPANGTNKFLVNVENSRDSSSEISPGRTHSYVYYPEQRDAYGDHWFPDGTVIPFTSIPGDFGPYFIARPNFIPQLGRWYSYELMVKANTPGQRDGRVAIWIDGNLMADFQNVRLRDTSSLKIDKITLDLHAKTNTARVNKKWYDNVVVARSYIGPTLTNTSTAQQLAPPTQLRIVP